MATSTPRPTEHLRQPWNIFEEDSGMPTQRNPSEPPNYVPHRHRVPMVRQSRSSLIVPTRARREPCALPGFPQGRVLFTYIGHYSTWATGMLPECTVCPKGGCYSPVTRPGNAAMYDLQCACSHDGRALPSANHRISAWERSAVGPGPFPSQFISEAPYHLD